MSLKEIAGVDCESVAAELVAQREFFEFHRTPAEVGEHEASAVALPVARYTGTRSGDEELNLRVGAMRLLGMSDRAIERECGVDRRTIPHRLRWLEDTRRIPALKQRLATVTGNAAETSGLVLQVLLNRVQSGEVDADLASTIKAVATAHGITVEKYQLVTGGATERVEQIRPADQDEARAWAASIVDVRAEVVAGGQGAIDSTSTQPAQISEISEAFTEPCPAGDTMLVPDDTVRIAQASGCAQAEEGGGRPAVRAEGVETRCVDGVQNL